MRTGEVVWHIGHALPTTPKATQEPLPVAHARAVQHFHFVA